jgi:hypothetical protein
MTKERILADLRAELKARENEYAALMRDGRLTKTLAIRWLGVIKNAIRYIEGEFDQGPPPALFT